VIPFCLLDGLEIGAPCHPCGGGEGGTETITFPGAESRDVGFSKHRQEFRPPRLGSIGHPLQRGVLRELGCNSS